MILKNPIDKNLTIKFLGVEYSLGANATKEFPDDVAEYWRTKLHKFLIVEKTLPTAPKVEPTEDSKPLISETHKEVKVEVKPKK